MQARDTALFALLYGCGLRIAEALALDVRDAPGPVGGALRVVGKGAKQRIVPVLPAVRAALAGWLALHPDRARLQRSVCGRARRAAGCGGGATDAAAVPAAARHARACDTARAAPFFRDPSAGGGRGSALDPGPAGTCQPVDNAAIYRVETARLMEVWRKAHPRA